MAGSSGVIYFGFAIRPPGDEPRRARRNLSAGLMSQCLPGFRESTILHPAVKDKRSGANIKATMMRRYRGYIQT